MSHFPEEVAEADINDINMLVSPSTTLADINDLIKNGDTDGDGQISAKEYEMYTNPPKPKEGLIGLLPSITTWTSPLETATVFLPTLAVLVAIGCYSIISVISTSCLLMLLAVSLSKLYTHVMVNILAKKPAELRSDPLHKLYALDLTVEAECVENIIGTAVSSVNGGLSQLRSLFLFHNLVDSLKFGVAMYCITYIGSMCNLLTIITFAWITLFTFPRLYTDNQEAIDSLVERMFEQVEQVKSKTMSLVSRKGGAAPTPAKSAEKTPEKEE